MAQAPHTHQVRYHHDALHPTPLAETPSHRHCARLAAEALHLRGHCVQLPWRAARARFAPWRTGRPRTEHARAGGLGVVVFAANARRAPPHAVCRGYSAPTPRQVDGCGFATRFPPRSTRMARGPRAFRPVENKPTAHGAHALVWCCEPLSREHGQCHRHGGFRVNMNESSSNEARLDALGFGSNGVSSTGVSQPGGAWGALLPKRRHSNACGVVSCHSSVGVRSRHGWSTASVGQRGNKLRARRYSLTLGCVQ